MLAVLALSAALKAQQPNSVQSSPNSATPAAHETLQEIVNASAAAANELKQNRRLVNALEQENKMLGERLSAESRLTSVLRELNETRKSEADALRLTLAAKNEAIAAKDAVISRQDQLIRDLKKKRSSPWKRIGDVLLGVAILAVIK